MKNKFLFIALTAIIGFSFAALSLTGCDDGGRTTVVPVTGVTLDQSTINLTVNSSVTLIATVTPDNATNKTVLWSASNAAAATVSNGVVTAVAAGTATITVTTKDGGKTAICVVTVTSGNSGTPNLPGNITINPSTGVNINTELTATYSGSETVSYQWKKGDADVGTNSNKFTPTTAGSYTVTVSAEGYNNKTSSAVNVSGGSVSDTPITSVAISVTAPEKDEVPATTATASGTVNYTIGTVTWSPTDNPYQGGKQYTVTVTLTAVSGYTFTGLITATINGQTATVSNNTGETVRLSHAFPATNTKSVMAIGVQFQPSKMSYNHNETLNLAGLIIQIIYIDSTTESVPLANFTARNITTSPANGETLSVAANHGKPVTITYGSHTVDTGSLTVNPIAPILDDFNVSGADTFTYDGTVRTVTVTAKEGKTTGTVTVKYNGSETAPSSVGTYQITFDVAADANYTASSLNGGTLTILADADAPYIITGNGTSFTATRNGATVGTAGQPIQTVINAIRTDAAGNARTIQFGNGTDVLNIESNSVSFNNTGGTWGLVTLTGKITGSNTSSTAGTVVIANNVSIISSADIANSSSGRAIYNNSTGTVSISGGTVSATTGVAIRNNSTGKITVSQASGATTLITSANTNTALGTIYIVSSGTATATRLEITGGTVENTATTMQGVRHHFKHNLI